MNKERYLRIVTVIFLIMFTIVSLSIVLAVESEIAILTAYSTSATADSTPVTELLNPANNGLWKPQTKDAGTNEGIFYQFTTPVLIDWIEVKVKKNSNCQLDFYLDGKRNISEQEKRNSEYGSDRVEYLSTYKDIGDERLFYLGTRGRNQDQEIPCAYLNAKVKSVFIKIAYAKSIPQFTSVRFFQRSKKTPISITIPRNNIGKVTVSSVLNPQTAYGAHNLFDSRTDFAWATDGKLTTGVGETIDINFDNPQDVSGIILWNGYQRSRTHFIANARPSKIQARVNDEAEFSLSVADKMDAQRIRFPKVYSGVSKLSLKIENVYTGAAYKDMVISELKIMDQKGSPLVFNVPSVEINLLNDEHKNLLDVSLTPYMLGILRTQNESNKYHSTDFWAAYDYPRRSLRIRSNGSFVGYFGDGFITEGNWEPLPDGFRIFGKKYVTYYDDSIYMQNSTRKENEAKIFQETMKIINLNKTPYAEAKKHLKTLLAERGYYRIIKENPGPVIWWMGIEPYENAKLTGNTEEEMLKACYEQAVKLKAYFIVSPMSTDLFMPEDKVQHSSYDF